MKKNTKGIVISITDFIGFVNKSGGSKMTKVKQLKSRDMYHPSKDFYKLLREEIVELHQKGNQVKFLEHLLDRLTDIKKRNNYPVVIEGYKKFIGRKKIIWFEPPSKHWLIGDLDVKINPELGLRFGTKAVVIKLYLSADKITKDKVMQILSLMESELRSEVDEEVVFGILDVKTGKLFENANKDVSYLPLLEGEARSFEIIWKGIN
ncbi:hypothetical protein [Flavobacterium sp. XGLA_31]|uniref:hypothetical protein n=1 Tax=Flavobacterium sp. XGLA_31 TaxID=3447666 RepID=UPI003F38D01A